MAIAHSKVTAQGQISIPAKIRQKLGVNPGSILEWDEEGGNVIVRKSGRYSSRDIHKALFPSGPPKSKTLKELKQGVDEFVKNKHARD